MSDTYKVNESAIITQKIFESNNMIMTLDGQIDQAKINHRLIGTKKHKISCKCMACQMVQGLTKSIHNPFYSNGVSIIQHFCSICRVKITFQATLCRSCKDKEHSRLMSGRKMPYIIKLRKGKKFPKHSERMRGKNNPHYIDGRTILWKLIKNLSEYKEWRKTIFERDYYTCQKCDTRAKSNNLAAHHLKSFSLILHDFLINYSQFSPIEDKETLVRLATSYRPFWDKNNGKTLCTECHKLTPNYGDNGNLKGVLDV